LLQWEVWDENESITGRAANEPGRAKCL